MSKLGEQADLMHYGIDKLYHTSTDSDTPLTQTETKHLSLSLAFPCHSVSRFTPPDVGPLQRLLGTKDDSVFQLRLQPRRGADPLSLLDADAERTIAAMLRHAQDIVYGTAAPPPPPNSTHASVISLLLSQLELM
mmetsp:Transcript_57746/g.125592  ORF Transcript_57746/g.125592 Transcript_57746/m.125592 type:complete len:135 (+) Transcript_57746:1367-1771(+)